MGMPLISLGGAAADPAIPAGSSEKDQEVFLEHKCRRRRKCLLLLPLEVLG